MLSDRGPNFVGTVVAAMKRQLGVKQVLTSPLHPQGNGCVERWNRTLAQDLACFVSIGSEDWDAHVSLACFRYNTGVHEATGMTPYEAMFGDQAFMASGTEESLRVGGEPYNIGKHLQSLHRRLIQKGKEARGKAGDQYNKGVPEVEFEVGYRVLVWSPELSSKEGKKIIPAWMGPYCVDRVLSPVSYLLRSEIGDKMARVHANRIRKISPTARQTVDARNGVFPDGLRLLRRMHDSRIEVDRTTGKRTPWFKVQLAGRKSPKWTQESDLPEIIVDLLDNSPHGTKHAREGEEE